MGSLFSTLLGHADYTQMAGFKRTVYTLVACTLFGLCDLLFIVRIVRGKIDTWFMFEIWAASVLGAVAGFLGAYIETIPHCDLSDLTKLVTGDPCNLWKSAMFFGLQGVVFWLLGALMVSSPLLSIAHPH